MKKLGLVLGLLLMMVGAAFAQRNNIAPEIQAERDMAGIERKMLKENTDAEGVKFIKEHDAAKRKMDAQMRQLPGYGNAATDKASLEKFREKNAKKDSSFKALSDKENETRIAKENYISSVNEEYKKHKSVSQGN